MFHDKINNGSMKIGVSKIWLTSDIAYGSNDNMAILDRICFYSNIQIPLPRLPHKTSAVTLGAWH